MSTLASTLLTKLNELSSIESSGDTTRYSVCSAFKAYLSDIGYEGISVSSSIDIADGVYVKFEDNEGDSVIVLFTTSQGYPQALVVSEDDEQLEIDLSGIDPPMKGDLIDLTDLSWLNKSVLDAILQAGSVDEDSSYVLRGGQKIKLPVVRIRSSKSEYESSVSRKVDGLDWSQGDFDYEEEPDAEDSADDHY